MLDEKIIDILENNEIKLSEKYEADNNEFYHEVEFYSDAGEDVVETVFYNGTSEDFIRAFREMAMIFDADEHAAMWVDLRGKRGVPNSIRVLCDDADNIKEFLLKVADELENIKDNEIDPDNQHIQIWDNNKCEVVYDGKYENIPTQIDGVEVTSIDNVYANCEELIL